SSATPPFTNASGRGSSWRPSASRSAFAWSMRRLVLTKYNGASGKRWSMSWQRVRGHDLHIRAFDRAVARGRLAHAYLFTGTAGIGKRHFAAELAKALLCEQRADQLQACDHCGSCVLVDAGTYPDY